MYYDTSMYHKGIFLLHDLVRVYYIFFTYNTPYDAGNAICARYLRKNEEKLKNQLMELFFPSSLLFKQGDHRSGLMHYLATRPIPVLRNIPFKYKT